PARTAPSERVLPRATSQSRAPTPRMGRAAVAILRRNPKYATIQGVEVVPSVAPMLTAIAWVSVTRPAPTKPMTARNVAVEDGGERVRRGPDRTGLNRPDTTL